MAKILEVELTSVDPIVVEIELEGTDLLHTFKGGRAVRQLMARHRMDPANFQLSALRGLEYVADVPEPYRELHAAYQRWCAVENQVTTFALITKVRELLDTVVDKADDERPPKPRT